MSSIRTTLTIACVAIALCIGLRFPQRPFQTRTPSSDPLLSNALPAIVMILAMDVENGQLTPVSSGSGTVIDAQGTILTNFHVVHNSSRGRLHDLFVVGVQRDIAQATTLYCVGDPTQGILNPDTDLALLHCDRDLSGHPLREKQWSSIPVAPNRTARRSPGEKVWILGYPGGNSGRVQISSGVLSDEKHSNPTGQNAYLETDIIVSHGSSGGAVIDSKGQLIGVASAFRKRTIASGSARVPTARVGLIRPIEQAYELIANVHPRDTGQALGAHHPGSSDSKYWGGKVLDARTGQGIEGATAMVFRAGITPSQVAIGTLGDQVLRWAVSNAAGDFTLSVPSQTGAEYTFGVTAKGYFPVLTSHEFEDFGDENSKIGSWTTVSLLPQTSRSDL